MQGCCWWGRGSLSIKGTCLYGKLNYHLGKNKAERDGRETAMFPDVDFCRDPGQVCSGSHSILLRWISGLYHWMENVQRYNARGFEFKNALVRYVNEDLTGDQFFEQVTNIHLFGCHECAIVEDMDDRLRNFEMILRLFGLQFGSNAKPEKPFQVFPGQQKPTTSPTMSTTEEQETITEAPTLSPIESLETIDVPVNVFLTRVPSGVNMTNDEQRVFESVMLDLLVPRLKTVDVTVFEVMTVSQQPNPEYIADPNFDRLSGATPLPSLQGTSALN